MRERRLSEAVHAAPQAPPATPHAPSALTDSHERRHEGATTADEWVRLGERWKRRRHLV